MAAVSERPVTLASHLTVGELLRARARFTPHAIALADDEREWTYGQFNERVNRLAHALRTVNNAEDFRGGWYHMGDAFVRNSDATLRFVDRVKYLIKSGGENIYPAEIESVLLADPRIEEAVVVRKPNSQWGEVPVAFVAASDPGLTADEATALCGASLARYKRPRDIRFVGLDAFPRSTTGKVQRHEVEKWLKE